MRTSVPGSFVTQNSCPQLEPLPLLTQQAQNGTLSWAKLREVARIATPDSEAFWI